MSPAEAMQALFEGWERRDADAIADVFTEDGIYDDPLKPERMVGREQIRAGNTPAVAAITECEIGVQHLLEQDNVCLAEGYFKSRVETGERMDFPFAAVLEMREGKIARLAEYFDTKPLLP